MKKDLVFFWNDYKKHLAVVGIVFVLIFSVYFFSARFTGHAVLNLDADYQEGQNLDGVLKLSLREGELIPSSTMVVFESSNQRKEFVLGDIVSGKAISGNYYIDGKNVSGEGMGFGVPGSVEGTTEISFKFRVVPQAASVGGGGVGEEEVADGEEEAVVEENETTEEVVSEENVTEEEAVETTTEETTTGETTIGEETVVGGIVIEETAAEETATEEVAAEEATEEAAPEEEASEPVVEETSEEASTSEEPEEPSPPLTGNVVLETETTFSGKASFDDPFVYNLESGQSIELVQGSVKIGGYALEDSVLDIDVTDNVAVFSTSYSSVDEGFGSAFLGDAIKDVEINLSAVDLFFGAGELAISFIYGDEEIISLSTELQEGSIEETGELVPEVWVPEVSVKNLTEEERSVISKKFGRVSLETTVSEVSGGRLVRNYKIGKYEMTASYDSSLSDLVLESQMRKDGISFLRDLATMLSEGKVSSESEKRFLGVDEF